MAPGGAETGPHGRLAETQRGRKKTPSVAEPSRARDVVVVKPTPEARKMPSPFGGGQQEREKRSPASSFSSSDTTLDEETQAGPGNRLRRGLLHGR
jgi:hypothetical protein